MTDTLTELQKQLLYEQAQMALNSPMRQAAAAPPAQPSFIERTLGSPWSIPLMAGLILAGQGRSWTPPSKQIVKALLGSAALWEGARGMAQQRQMSQAATAEKLRQQQLEDLEIATKALDTLRGLSAQQDLEDVVKNTPTGGAWRAFGEILAKSGDVGALQQWLASTRWMVSTEDGGLMLVSPSGAVTRLDKADAERQMLGKLLKALGESDPTLKSIGNQLLQQSIPPGVWRVTEKGLEPVKGRQADSLARAAETMTPASAGVSAAIGGVGEQRDEGGAETAARVSPQDAPQDTPQSDTQKEQPAYLPFSIESLSVGGLTLKATNRVTEKNPVWRPFYAEDGTLERIEMVPEGEPIYLKTPDGEVIDRFPQEQGWRQGPLPKALTGERLQAMRDALLNMRDSLTEVVDLVFLPDGRLNPNLVAGLKGVSMGLPPSPEAQKLLNLIQPMVAKAVVAISGKSATDEEYKRILNMILPEWPSETPVSYYLKLRAFVRDLLGMADDEGVSMRTLVKGGDLESYLLPKGLLDRIQALGNRGELAAVPSGEWWRELTVKPVESMGAALKGIVRQLLPQNWGKNTTAEEVWNLYRLSPEEVERLADILSRDYDTIRKRWETQAPEVWQTPNQTPKQTPNQTPKQSVPAASPSGDTPGGLSYMINEIMKMDQGPVPRGAARRRSTQRVAPPPAEGSLLDRLMRVIENEGQPRSGRRRKPKRQR